MKVSVIIPTYNRCQFIGLTLESFAGQNFDKGEFEIIVVDNNSTDNTQNVVETFIQSNPDFKIYYHVETLQGVHYARNTAAKIAKGEYLYFTDDDMIADTNLLNELLYLFGLDEKIASVTGTVLPKWEVKPPHWILKLCNNALLSLNSPSKEIIISETDCNVFSCHQMIKRNVFLLSGGFNPENTKGEWIGDGETGINIKIKELGFKFASNRKSITNHIIPPSRMTQTYLNKRLYNQGNCDTYTWYRQSKPSNPKLIIDILISLLKAFYNFAKYIVRLLSLNIKWRISLAYCYYYLARIKYNFKLITDDNWKELVLKTNWIEE